MINNEEKNSHSSFLKNKGSKNILQNLKMTRILKSARSAKAGEERKIFG